MFVQWLGKVITSVYVTHLSFPSFLLPQSHQMSPATPATKSSLKVERKKQGEMQAISFPFNQEKQKCSQSPCKYLLYLIGQNFITWSLLPARGSGKSIILSGPGHVATANRI